MSGAKKLKDIIPHVAEKTGYSEKEVQELVNLFYDEYVRENLSNFKHAHIYIEHLGVFSIRKKRIPNFIDKLEKQIKKNEKVLLTDRRLISGESPMKAVIEKQIVNDEKAIDGLTKIEIKINQCVGDRLKLHEENLKKYYNELGK